MSFPLVSCIMPTKNRREFLPKAIEYFLRQTYANKELLIMTDGGGWVRDLVPDIEGVRLLELSLPFSSLGVKRNACIAHTRGDLIAHWDDDDWYGPTRLAEQVKLMQMQGGGVCGIDAPVFFDLRTGQSYRYHFANGCPYGATLMYAREFWLARPFADIQVGETDPFMHGRWPAPSCGSDWFVGMIHEGNTVPKAIQTRYFSSARDIVAPSALVQDWPFYQSLREKMGAAA